jgi:hypothetical protein
VNVYLKLIFLLIRWARENDDRAFVVEFFPHLPASDRWLMVLEEELGAMDLRWALDILREMRPPRPLRAPS